MMDDHSQLAALLSSRRWRLDHLYWITDKEGRLVRFRMNREQADLFERLHFRNEILKARQLGISTFVALLMLDSCLFCPHFEAGIVDKTRDEAKKKLKKATLAYDLLDYVPPDGGEADRALAAIGREVKQNVPRVKLAETEARWGNGSGITVGASMRGGTLQMLHVSEMAYVASHNPIRAKEIQTGALQAVGKECVVIKESTHEGGRSGINYEMVVKAMQNAGKKRLSPLDYRFFFYAWHGNPDYELPAEFWTQGLDPTHPDYRGLLHERHKLAEYFAELEKLGIVLSDRKKAWYATQARTLGFTVRQEFPSTPDEAFDVVAERSIYLNGILRLKAAGRWSSDFEPEPLAPFYVAWDIGLSDFMSLWLIQTVPGGRMNVLNHHAANNQQLEYYIGVVRAWEAAYQMKVARCLLPHDARNRHPGGGSFEEAVRRAGFSTVVVPRTPDIWRGIQSVRQLLPYCDFHENCGREVVVEGKSYPGGLQCLENYQTIPEGSNGSLRTQPLHDRFSHSADAFRTFAEAWEAGLIGRDAGEAPAVSARPVRAVGADWL